MVTWDEAKRQLNIRNHGLDFMGCDAVFDGLVVHLTYTEHGEDLHAISLRKATKHETRYFFSEAQS